MEQLILRRYDFIEIMSVILTEFTNHEDTRYEVTVITLNDDLEEDKLVYRFKTQSKGTAFSTFEHKVNMLTGLVS